MGRRYEHRNHACHKCGKETYNPHTITCYILLHGINVNPRKTNAGYKFVCDTCYKLFLNEYTKFFPYGRTNPKENYR